MGIRGNLTGNLYYRTNYINEWDVKPCVDVEQLAKLLPHGSGIDSDWEISVYKNGNLKVSSSFHCMNEDGYYCGWQQFSFRIYRTQKDKLHALRDGKIQVIARKGDIQMSDVSIRDRNGFDLGNYLSDIIDFSITPLLTHRFEILDESK